jgi:hypothetical protein
MSNLIYILITILVCIMLFILSKGMGRLSKKYEIKYLEELKISIKRDSNEIIDLGAKTKWLKL